MFAFLARMFSPVADSDQETRQHILWWLFIRMFLYTILTGLALFFHHQGHPLMLPPAAATGAFLAVIYLHSIGSAFVVQKLSRSLRRFGLFQLLSDTIFTAVLVFATGCSQSLFAPVFLLPIIAAGLILSRIGGLFLAATATLFYGAILAAELLGWVPGYFLHEFYKAPTSLIGPANLFATYGLIFFLTALLSGMLARRLRFTEEKLSHTALEFDRLTILYKQIFDDITTGIITTDNCDRITSCNRAAERITGFSRLLVLGQPFAGCFPAISLQEGRQGRHVCDFRKKDGSMIRLGYSFSNLNMPVERSRDEQPAKWRVITLQDISQIERMELQVRRAEKMAAVGEMSASVAHGFRNALAAISGSAQILALEQENIGALDPATFKTLLAIVLRESDRMAKMITDFLQFARPAALQPEWFDLGRLIDEVVAGMRTGSHGLASAGIQKEIVTNLSCWADRQQLQVVLRHLLENACAMTGPGPGAVTVAAHETGSDPTAIHIEVRDQGPGIPPELREKVFEPFFSNRADGTGLGLAIVRQILDNHDGTVEIAAGDGPGCTVRLTLPLPTATPLPS